METARWKNAAREREYFELYAQLRDEGWPSTPRERDVDTRFGRTHVFAWEADGTPIVLLHGAVTSSLMWAPMISEFTGLPTYAIDVIGEPSLSTQTVPVDGSDDLVTWLTEALDQLGIERAHMCGASYGGWIACNAAIRVPERVATLSLVEPALDPLRRYFWVHGAMAGVSSLLPSAARRPLMRQLHMDAAADADPRVVRMARLGFTQFRRGLPRATPVTDEALASITSPTLLLLAEHSELHHAKSVCDRARANLPDVDAEVIPGTGHSLPLDRPALVGERIRTFVTAPRR
jgi:pimeloyl-ACP methyl ester carboxylesterase